MTIYQAQARPDMLYSLDGYGGMECRGITSFWGDDVRVRGGRVFARLNRAGEYVSHGRSDTRWIDWVEVEYAGGDANSPNNWIPTGVTIPVGAVLPQGRDAPPHA